MRTFLFIVLLDIGGSAAAQDAQTILHLLDYIGVDYPEAVENGKVKNEDEYKEMLEFTAQVAQRIAGLPENPAKTGLTSAARGLEKLVRDKAAPPAVAEASRILRLALVSAYKLRIAPRGAPPLGAAPALYARYCAGCHGAQGRGDGPAGKGLEPAPSSFHDHERLAQRSVYGLYNTISLGVEGTSMVAFTQLSEDQRWA